MSQPAVILVEKRPVEAVLACAALSLRPEVMVLRAEDLAAAAGLLRNVPVTLAILGKEALQAADGSKLRPFVSGGVQMVGLGVHLETVREKALASGVTEVHERPREWRAYRSLISSLVDKALATREG